MCTVAHGIFRDFAIILASDGVHPGVHDRIEHDSNDARTREAADGGDR